MTGGADVVGLNLTTLFERANPSLTPSFSGFRKRWKNGWIKLST